MADLARLFDFTANDTIRSADVDAEFNQLIARVNDLEPDSLQSAIAEKVGLSQTGSVRRGKTAIATAEARTNAAFGLLATPDRVSSVVLPTDGLLLIAYRALWKESAISTAGAGIFLGANQVTRALINSAPTAVTAAINSTSAGVDSYAMLATSHKGLMSHGSTASAAESLVTTGQIIGTTGDGGFCVVEAAAGTYDVSVQFNAQSGATVTAKDRVLRVIALGF